MLLLVKKVTRAIGTLDFYAGGLDDDHRGKPSVEQELNQFAAFFSRELDMMNVEIQEIAATMRKVIDEWIARKPGLTKETKGFCIAASLALQQALAKRGYRAEVIRGRFRDEGHARVNVENSIVDITLDQFGSEFPPICVFEGNAPDFSEGLEGQDAIDMGPQGDDGDWAYYSDTEFGREQCPMGGTTRSVAQEFIELYLATAQSVSS